MQADRVERKHAQARQQDSRFHWMFSFWRKAGHQTWPVHPSPRNARRTRNRKVTLLVTEKILNALGAFEPEQRSLDREAPSKAGQGAIGANDAMAWHNDR